MPLNPIPATNTCKRGCCWTPYGTCARGRTCSHHMQDLAEQNQREAQASLARELENLESLLVSKRSVRRP